MLNKALNLHGISLFARGPPPTLLGPLPPARCSPPLRHQLHLDKFLLIMAYFGPAEGPFLNAAASRKIKTRPHASSQSFLLRALGWGVGGGNECATKLLLMSDQCDAAQSDKWISTQS